MPLQKHKKQGTNSHLHQNSKLFCLLWSWDPNKSKRDIPRKFHVIEKSLFFLALKFINNSQKISTNIYMSLYRFSFNKKFIAAKTLIDSCRNIGFARNYSVRISHRCCKVAIYYLIYFWHWFVNNINRLIFLSS